MDSYDLSIIFLNVATPRGFCYFNVKDMFLVYGI